MVEERGRREGRERERKGVKGGKHDQLPMRLPVYFILFCKLSVYMRVYVYILLRIYDMYLLYTA